MKNRKNIFKLAIMHCLLVFTSTAQQEYQFANTASNPFLLNPAAGGLTDVMQFEVTTRMQWLGYEGGPRTILLSGNSQIGIGNSGEKALSEFNIHDETLFEGPKVSTGKTKHILGGKIWNDAIGPFSKTSIQGSYAYHLPLTKSINIGVGLGFGYSNFRLDETKVVLHQSDDNTYAQFLGSASQQGLGDAQAGFVLYNEKFFIGLSGTQVLNNAVKLNQILTNSFFSRHYFMIAKYRIEGSGDIAIEPTAVIKYTGSSPWSVDAGARVLYRNTSWFGLQFRTNSGLIFQVGSNLIKNLYVSYAYEYSMGKIRTAGNATHEIQLGYYLGKNRNIDKELKENKEGTKEM
ncbi:MAG: type IX secretion system membrane protein PorP/SprF [Flavobacteriia bacterium]|jgi:type IX secretion system PorP/SprF family membrane protein